jgi:hypothetical protein
MRILHHKKNIKMKRLNRTFTQSTFMTLIAIVFFCSPLQGQEKTDYKLQNPFNVDYLKKNLTKKSPRLVLNSEFEKNLRAKLKTDQMVQNIYKAIKYNAEEVLKKDLITLDIPENPNSQKNQLGISRDFLFRINMLAMVYRIEKDKRMLNRLNEEVIAACNFPTWNPKHFLDVGEMSLAIALALDWTAGDLPKSTIALAKKSLIEKGIKQSWPENGSTPSWVNNTNNWNQVCNAGMIAASIAVAELNPELAAKTIHRSIEGMNNALREYAPEGAYPEGPIYWGYGTQFSIITAAMFESAFGTDFGLADYPGFKESAVYAMLTISPTNRLYSYADCNEEAEAYGTFTLSWFAAKTGNKTFLDEKYFLTSPEEIKSFSRLAGAGLIWTAQFSEKVTTPLPTAWKGGGANPVVIFTGGEKNFNGFYFGGKGGRGTVNHGNMDGGSFIFELNGVRWSIDPGNQSYGLLERAGFNLWASCQDCDRWKLLTKNNFGHSTISVNNQLHVVDGMADIIDFKDGPQPEATFELSPAFTGQLKSAQRRFVKESAKSLLVEDKIEISEETKWITWQMLTQADVQIVKGGAVLNQDGQVLKLENLSHPEIMVSVISLDPPPLALDRTIDNLKRIEIRIPAWTVENGKVNLKVRLSGE